VNEPTGPEARAASGPVAFSVVAIVHGLAHVKAAIEAARASGADALTLVTARGAPDFAGAAWCAELERLARAEAGDLPLTFVTDCAAAPGRALEALACGASCVALEAKPAVFARVEAIASQSGARVLASVPAGFDFASVPANGKAPADLWRALTSNLD
jgi:hypothetical protein